MVYGVCILFSHITLVMTHDIQHNSTPSGVIWLNYLFEI